MKISHQDLLLYVSDELTPERRDACERILLQDPEARRALEGLREQERRLAGLPLLRPSRDLVAPALAAVRRPAAGRPWFASPPLLASAAAILLLLGATALLLPRFRPAPAPLAQLSPPPPPVLDDIPREDELDLRIARLRSDLGARYRPAVAPPPRFTESVVEVAALDDVRGRIETLQTRCRPQVASANAANPFDSRLGRLKSRLDSAREELQDVTLSRLRKIPGLAAIIAAVAGFPSMDEALPAQPAPRAGPQRKPDVETRRHA